MRKKTWTHFLGSKDMIVCTVGATGAQQEKRWPADLAVTGSRVAGAMIRTVNGGPPHTAFHYLVLCYRYGLNEI